MKGLESGHMYYIHHIILYYVLYKMIFTKKYLNPNGFHGNFKYLCEMFSWCKYFTKILTLYVKKCDRESIYSSKTIIFRQKKIDIFVVRYF